MKLRLLIPKNNTVMKTITMIACWCLLNTVYAKPALKGTYACCRNSFMVKFKSNNQFEVTRTNFGPTDEITGNTKIYGTYTTDGNIVTLNNQTQKTIQIKYSRKFKKDIPMWMPTPKKYKTNIALKMDNEQLYWKSGTEWQVLYLNK